MIKNYFKIAFRGFWKHRLFTLINIISLSIGISAALVIYLIAYHDFTFDKFHKDGDRIYRVVSVLSFQGNPNYNSGVCGPIAAAAKSEATGIEEIAPFYTLYQSNVFIPGKGNIPVKFKDQDNVILADQNYFKIFNCKWLAGSPKTALAEPNQVVLTSAQASIYFPSIPYDQMIGKIVTYDSIKTTVIGIVQTIKQNTDFTFHDFISYSTNKVNKDIAEQLRLDQWENTSSGSQLFVKILSTASAGNVEKQLNGLLKKYSPLTSAEKGNTHIFKLQPLNDIHFNTDYGSFDFSGIAVNKNTLYSLFVLALFLLLLGCINFINLTTAQATQRAKEIGVRKTMGCSRKQLIIQFLSETFIITAFSVLISIILAPFILKLFADFIPKGVNADFFQPDLIIFLLGLTLVVSLAAGFYPAIMLSGYNPVMVLKNQTQNNSSKTRNTWLRKSLTVTQFITAQFFIMATVLVSKQIYYALHKDLGFKKDAIIVINTPWKNNTANKRQLFFNKLHAIPQISLVSSGGNAPSSGGMQSTDVSYVDGKKEIKTDLQLKYGDENYINVYQIKLLAGRDFTPADTSKQLIINSTYAKLLGFTRPEQAIGNYIDMDKKKCEIIGVAVDFYQASLRRSIKPLAIIYRNERQQNGTFHIAMKPQSLGGIDWKKGITAMQAVWKELYPDDDFDYQFYDESIAKFYEKEQKTAALLKWATGLSIFISCLGLLGLAIYTTNQRTKEIGVRKVLGASVMQIVTLLSKELIILILLAFVVATPIAWWSMNKWMQGYADRTNISWWIFALSGAGMLLTAVFTSSFQTVRAAIVNPVKSLRSE